MTTVTRDLTARDVMASEPICVEPAMTLRKLARTLDEHGISGAPVVDAEGRVIGVVSKTDLLWRCLQGTGDVAPAYLFELLAEQSDEEQEMETAPIPTVQDFMTEDPATVAPGTPAAEVARLMFEGRFHRVIVVDDERFPLGIITSLDLLGSYHQAPLTRGERLMKGDQE